MTEIIDEDRRRTCDEFDYDEALPFKNLTELIKWCAEKGVAHEDFTFDFQEGDDYDGIPSRFIISYMREPTQREIEHRAAWRERVAKQQAEQQKRDKQRKADEKRRRKQQYEELKKEFG